jgi:hypothetical protein
MSCPVQKFTTTPAQFSAIAARIMAEGVQVDPTATSGTISHSGAIVEWSYDGTELTVTCTAKPWFISCDVVNKEIAGWFTTV